MFFGIVERWGGVVVVYVCCELLLLWIGIALLYELLT